MDARCFYGRFVNGILDHLGPRLGPDARAQLAALGVSPSELHEIYRAATFFAAIPILAGAVAPGSPPDDAEYALGREVIHGYMGSDEGRAMAGYFAQLGTRATLVEMETFFRTADNFVRARPAVLGDRHVRVRLAGTGGHPQLFRGIIEAAYHFTGETGLRAEIVAADADTATYDVTW